MPKGLVRRPDDGWLGGVCAGLARHYGWDVTRVRLAFVLFGLFGAGELAYLVLWVVVPREETRPPPPGSHGAPSPPGGAAG